MNNHKGKAITEWIDILLNKYIKLKKDADRDVFFDTPTAKEIPFKSTSFKSKNIEAAIHESRGAFIGSIDILNYRYDKKATIGQVLSHLISRMDYHFNKDILELLKEEDVRQVDTIHDATDELLKIVLTLTLEVKELKNEINELKNHANGNMPNNSRRM